MSKDQSNKTTSDNVSAEDLREIHHELEAIRRLLEFQKAFDPEGGRNTIEKAVQAYRQLPTDAEDAIRWGFIGAWGSGGLNGVGHAALSIHTTNIPSFFSAVSSEDVAAFASVYTNPDTIEICKYLFQHEGTASRADLMQDCGLDEESLAEAIKPLLAWHFVKWQGDQLVKAYHGVNWALTLISMATEGMKQKTNKWD